MLEYNDKVYKRMTHAGAAGIVLGIMTIVTGIAIGTITIVFGGKVLKLRKHLLD